MRALAFHSEQESVPLDRAVAEFLEDCRFRNLSPHTLEWYQYALQPFVRYAANHGVRDAESVTERLLRAFLSEQAASVSPRRVNHYREAIDRFYRWLAGEGSVGHNPAGRLAKLREPQKLVPTFSEDELRRLLDQADRRTFLGLRDYAFMLVLLDTGVRGEDVDFDTAILRVMGKGGKERMVGVSADSLKHLRQYVRRREIALTRIGRSGCEWLFPNQNGGKGGAKGFQMALKRYGRGAGISRCHPHRRSRHARKIMEGTG